MAIDLIGPLEDKWRTCKECGQRLLPTEEGRGQCFHCMARQQIATTKPTNPKDAIGSDKMPLHLWPESATAMGTLALLNGALKYGRANWRDAGVRVSIYIDALLRHAYAYWEGEDVDPDDGVPHLAAMLACVAIIVDAGATDKLIDDRAYNGSGLRKLMDELTPHVKRLKEQHAGRNPHHYTIADNKPQEDQ